MINLHFTSSCATLALFKIRHNWINTEKITKGDKESPRKILHFISSCPYSEFLASKIALHFSILLTNKILTFSATLN